MREIVQIIVRLECRDDHVIDGKDGDHDEEEDAEEEYDAANDAHQPSPARCVLWHTLFGGERRDRFVDSHG